MFVSGKQRINNVQLYVCIVDLCMFIVISIAAPLFFPGFLPIKLYPGSKLKQLDSVASIYLIFIGFL